MLEMKANELLNEFSEVGNKMVSLIEDMVVVITNGGEKTIEIGNFPIVDYDKIKCDKCGVFLIDNSGNEVDLYDISTDDEFNIITMLTNDKFYTVV